MSSSQVVLELCRAGPGRIGCVGQVWEARNREKKCSLVSRSSCSFRLVRLIVHCSSSIFGLITHSGVFPEI